ncbi:alpha/beta hydrolase [Spirosoma sp. SC4-14]|uniref:alpha/beta hydrolase n=1 Tax=Spirosoma sp. SC4-14 TaxID=3128900 RepID=UPI0030D17A53
MYSDWYDWIDKEIQNRHGISIIRLKMPNWHQPNIAESAQYLFSQIDQLTPSTYFIAHSVGCQAVIRFLATKIETDPGLKIGGLLFVAAWINVVKSWSTLDPWLNNATLPYQAIANRSASRKVVISDNDPFTPDYKANETLWHDQLHADVTLCHGRAHFNGAIEPAVLEAFEDMMSANPSIP